MHMSITTDELISLKQPNLKQHILPVLTHRFSPRFFTNESIPVSDIKTFFEAARWAPSARNRQPWFFYYSHKGKPAHAKLLSTIPTKHNWTQSAPLLILATYEKSNEFGVNEYGLYDLATAVYALVIQAQSMGYYCRQVGTFDRLTAKKLFAIPDPFEPFVLVAVGSIGNYKDAPEELVALERQPRERKNNIYQELK